MNPTLTSEQMQTAIQKGVTPGGLSRQTTGNSANENLPKIPKDVKNNMSKVPSLEATQLSSFSIATQGNISPAALASLNPIALPRINNNVNPFQSRRSHIEEIPEVDDSN